MGWQRRIGSVFDLAVAAMIAYSGTMWIRAAGIGDMHQFSSGVLGAGLWIVAVLIALSACFISSMVLKWCRALYAYIGRGILFIFFGALCVREDDIVTIVLGAIAVATGVVYLVLQFISTVGYPQPLFARDASMVDIDAHRVVAIRTTTTKPVYAHDGLPPPRVVHVGA